MATSDLERKVETTPVKTSIIDAIVNRKVIIRRSEISSTLSSTFSTLASKVLK